MSRNKSFFLIMPLLGFPADFVDSAGFINTYVKHSDFPELRNHLFLLCEYDKVSQKNQVTYKLRNDKNFVSSVSWPELGYELFIYTLEEDLHEDLVRFIAGKYSHFSETAKKRILNVFVPLNRDKNVTKNWAVLYPTSEESTQHVEELEEKIGMKLTGDFQILSRAKRDEETFKLSDLIELYEEEPTDYLYLV